MRLEHVLHYDADVDAVLTMLTDPEFRAAVCDAMGCAQADVEIIEDPDGFEVIVDQIQKTEDLPAFARAFAGPTTRAIQRESWGEDATARLVIEAPGKPSKMSGTIALQADGDRTREVITLDIGIKVPLIGAKLERLMADKVRAGYEVEGRVGEAWLAGDDA